tara:strand:+ start:973 stop:1491 length:519 start_codon:yes stop_codon:yes gene_type:complete
MSNQTSFSGMPQNIINKVIQHTNGMSKVELSRVSKALRSSRVIQNKLKNLHEISMRDEKHKMKKLKSELSKLKNSIKMYEVYVSNYQNQFNIINEAVSKENISMNIRRNVNFNGNSSIQNMKNNMRRLIKNDTAYLKKQRQKLHQAEKSLKNFKKSHSRSLSKFQRSRSRVR